MSTGIPLPSSRTVTVPSELIFTLIFLQKPANAYQPPHIPYGVNQSSIIPGLFLTASKPLRTLIELSTTIIYHVKM